MDIQATYLEWPAFSALAGEDFEERCHEHAESEEGTVPGELPVDEADEPSDSFHAFEDAADFLDGAVGTASPWRAFVEQGFLALIQGEPAPRNDLGCEVDPELYAAILSPASVREIVGPTVGKPVPWSAAPEELRAEIGRWHAIWRKAMDRGLGIAYHVG